MAEGPWGETVMKSLGLVVFLVVAAAAVPAELPAGDNEIFKCAVNREFNLVLKEHKAPFYLCSSVDGNHFLVAAPVENLNLESNFETYLPKGEVLKLREVSAIVSGPAAVRPKRSPQFGGGFGGAGSQASAQAGSFGGGGGFGPFGIGGGGGFSNAQASSGAGGFGGGGGFPGFYGR